MEEASAIYMINNSNNNNIFIAPAPFEKPDQQRQSKMIHYCSIISSLCISDWKIVSKKEIYGDECQEGKGWRSIGR